MLAHTRDADKDDDGQDDSLEGIIKASSRQAAKLDNEPIAQAESNETDLPVVEQR